MQRSPAAIRWSGCVLAAAGDDHGRAGDGGDLGRLDLGLHAAARQLRPGGAGHRLDLGRDALDQRDVARRRVVRRRRRVEPVDVGEEDQEVGAHHGGDARRQAIVVAVADLAGRDGVVLVDDGDGAEPEERADGRAGIEVAPPLLGVAEGEQDLPGGEAVALQRLGIGAGERDLPDRGGRLALLETQRPGRQIEDAPAEGDGAGGDDEEVAPAGRERGKVGGERIEPGALQPLAVDEERRADLDDDAAEGVERRRHGRAGVMSSERNHHP